MPKSAYVQDVRYSVSGIAGFCSRQILSTYIRVGNAKERICTGCTQSVNDMARGCFKQILSTHIHVGNAKERTYSKI